MHPLPGECTLANLRAQTVWLRLSLTALRNVLPGNIQIGVGSSSYGTLVAMCIETNASARFLLKYLVKVHAGQEQAVANQHQELPSKAQEPSPAHQL